MGSEVFFSPSFFRNPVLCLKKQIQGRWEKSTHLRFQIYVFLVSTHYLSANNLWEWERIKGENSRN